MRVLSVFIFAAFVFSAQGASAKDMLHCTCVARDGEISKCLPPNTSCTIYCEEKIGFSMLKTKEKIVKCGSSECPETDVACLRELDDSGVTWPKFALDYDAEIKGTETIEADAERVDGQQTTSLCSPEFDGEDMEVVQSSIIWDWQEDKRQRHYCKGIGSCGLESFPARRMRVLKYDYLKDGSDHKICLIVRNSWITKESSFHLKVWLKDK